MVRLYSIMYFGMVGGDFQLLCVRFFRGETTQTRVRYGMVWVTWDCAMPRKPGSDQTEPVSSVGMHKIQHKQNSSKTTNIFEII